jgi:hypothetical protein
MGQIVLFSTSWPRKCKPGESPPYMALLQNLNNSLQSWPISFWSIYQETLEHISNGPTKIDILDAIIYHRRSVESVFELIFRF